MSDIAVRSKLAGKQSLILASPMARTGRERTVCFEVANGHERTLLQLEGECPLPAPCAGKAPARGQPRGTLECLTALERFSRRSSGTELITGA